MYSKAEKKWNKQKDNKSRQEYFEAWCTREVEKGTVKT